MTDQDPPPRRMGRPPQVSARLAEQILAAYPPPSSVTIRALGDAIKAPHYALWRALQYLRRAGRAAPDGAQETSKGHNSTTWRLS